MFLYFLEITIGFSATNETGAESKRVPANTIGNENMNTEIKA